jgi:hypothetical protein
VNKPARHALRVLCLGLALGVVLYVAYVAIGALA